MQTILLNSRQNTSYMDTKFKKGHKQTPEERLRCIEGLRKSWKKRADYLGILKTSPLFNCYRAFRFTKRGKKAGCSERWKDYKNFYADMVGTYSKGMRLVRLDKSKPFCFENCRWVTNEESAQLRDCAATLTHNGETKTLKEWSIELNIYYSALRQRYYRGKGYTSDEILFGKMKQPSKAMSDINMLSGQKKKDKVSKMVAAYRCKDKKRGMEFNLTNEWFLNNIISQQCTYCGTSENVGCDRIDNTKGHTTDNVIPACYTCNTIRNNLFTVEEMKEVGKTVSKILQRRKLKVA